VGGTGLHSFGRYRPQFLFDVYLRPACPTDFVAPLARQRQQLIERTIGVLQPFGSAPERSQLVVI
jgi:hypothetical protein